MLLKIMSLFTISIDKVVVKICFSGLSDIKNTADDIRYGLLIHRHERVKKKRTYKKYK